MGTHSSMNDFSCLENTGASWSILSDIEKSIKAKIETVGTPLKDWDIQINYGIKTGYNDAFIINSEKRQEILDACLSEEERLRTDELIRPILRGRDIKRYSYDWADLWLINTHNGYQDVDRIHIEDYPAIKQHLDAHYDKLAARVDKGATPYNLRNCAYMDYLSLPKIIWKRVGSILRFSYDTSGIYALDSTCFAVGKDVAYICCVLNSSLGHYLLKDSPQTGTGDLLISVQAVEPLRLPFISANQANIFQGYVKKLSDEYSDSLQKEVDNIIYELYQLTNSEIEYIKKTSETY